MTATHNLTHNLLTAPAPRTPLTLSPLPCLPLPRLPASQGKQCWLLPGSCTAARPVAALEYSVRQLASQLA